MQQSTLLGVATKYRPEHFLLCWKFVMHSHDLTQWDFLGPKCLQSSLIWPPSLVPNCWNVRNESPTSHIHSICTNSKVDHLLFVWLDLLYLHDSPNQHNQESMPSEQSCSQVSALGDERDPGNVGTKCEDETEKKMTFYWSWWSENRFSNISMLVKLYCSRAFQHGGVSLVTEPYFCV